MLRIESQPRAEAPRPSASSRGALHEGRPAGPARLGVEVTLDDLAAPAPAAELAAALRPDHLHLAISARGPDPDFKALAHVLDAAQAELRLDVLDLPSARPAPLLESLAVRIAAAAVVPTDVAVFPSTHECVAAARAAFPRARIGGGTPDFFIQLNRQERLPALDFLWPAPTPARRVCSVRRGSKAMSRHCSPRGRRRSRCRTCERAAPDRRLRNC